MKLGDMANNMDPATREAMMEDLRTLSGDVEGVLPLTGEPDFDAVHDEGSARVFRARSRCILHRETFEVMLDLHGLGRPLLGYESPVRVLDEPGGTTVAFASLDWEGDQLSVSMAMDYARPERLLIESDPALWVEIAFGTNDEDRNVVQVNYLWFTTRRPDDARELPLEPVEG